MLSCRIAVVALSLSLSALSVAGAPADAAARPGPASESGPPATEPSGGTPATTSLDNPFLPEEANVGDCVSALPRPDCGSKARGGWRQALVFVVLLGAIAVVGLRLVLGLRKRARPGSQAG